jgi:hypothetical protein
MNDQHPKAFWLVWSPQGARPPKHKHASEKSAKVEAERMAQTYRDADFYVLRATHMSHVPPPVVCCTYTLDPAEDDDVPF